MNQRREINDMQQYKASNRAEKMIIQMGKDLIKGTKEVKKEIVKVEKEMTKVYSFSFFVRPSGPGFRSGLDTFTITIFRYQQNFEKY